MGREPRFVQVIPAALDELAEEHGLDFIEQAVLARSRDEACWQSGAISNWTTTGYAAEWRIGYRLLKRALAHLVELGLLECTATRGHPGELVVTPYRRLVKVRPDDIDPGRSRESATAGEPAPYIDPGRCRDSAITNDAEQPPDDIDPGRSRESATAHESRNRESARAQPRQRDSDQEGRPPDLEDVVVEVVGLTADELRRRHRRLTELHITRVTEAQKRSPAGIKQSEYSFKAGVREKFTAKHPAAELAEVLAADPHLTDEELLHELDPNVWPPPPARPANELDADARDSTDGPEARARFAALHATLGSTRGGRHRAAS